MRLNKERILDVAEQLIWDQGYEQTSLIEIAKALDVTHAALYRHYRNKEDLLTSLAKRWLQTIMVEVMAYEGSSLADWLWLLATTKRARYNDQREMFLLYSKYIDDNLPLVEAHLQELAEKAEQVSGTADGMGIILAMQYFTNPHFAPRWNGPDYEAQFKALWRVIESGVAANE